MRKMRIKKNKNNLMAEYLSETRMIMFLLIASQVSLSLFNKLYFIEQF